MVLNLRSTFGRLWELIRSWFWQGLVAVLLILFVVLFIRPFSSPDTPTAEDIGKSWNDSFERLGIIPVFPPEEDFNVGDVWAVVESSQEAPDLQSKSVRIGHIELRQELEEARKFQFVFAETAAKSPSDGIRRQDPTEVQKSNSDSRIYLTLTAFPGLTISRTTHASGSLGWGFGGFGAGREDQRLEEVRIPVAETYGVSPVAAFIKLDDWCAAFETKIYCTDAFLRRALAYSIGERVLAARNGKYLVKVQLRLVTRVFLTREIEQHRLTMDANGILVRPTSDPKSSGPLTGVRQEAAASSADNKSLEERGGKSIKGLTEGASTATSPGSPSSAASQFLSGGTEMEVHQAFQRPIAFGYRAITISVPPSIPSDGASR